ncbi:TlpA family protein disulfide reductase [Luteimonas sp. SJ-92]|uniref:TlpA family protein disulfide reductase n=1 Tax=Luteimonas salinisoli TaxID=2752307 RepID=A0A853J7K0_9GAMM|nr:TlpA disulfide reductase family protein [Luteimonas salinisoli]NZA25063.1 TlpA family protein disulfide reductase [Luteimonas salinisoli]
MRGATKVVLVALAAGALGVAASLLIGGPGPLLRTEPGQRLAQRLLQANAPPPPGGVAVAERGGQVPVFSVAALDGGQWVLPGDFAGRPLLVNVWASWCGPCIEEMPELDRYARAQAGAGTRVLGIALDDADAVRGFLERVPVSYPLAIDTPGNADAGVRLGNPRGVLPYSVLVSADGRVLKQRIGPFEHGEIEAWAQH